MNNRSKPRQVVGIVLSALWMSVGAACSPAVSQKEMAQAKIHYDIAVRQMNGGDMRGALRELLATVEFDPYLAHAHNALGLVYHSLGHTDEALQHYQKAVQLDPKFSAAQNNYGTLLTALGRYDEAIKSFSIAVGDILYPTPSMAEGNMGWAYYKKGDVEQGIRHLGNAIATDPKFCRGYEWLMRIGLDTDRPEMAISNHARFQRRCVKDPNIGPGIPTVYLQQMDYYLGLGHLKQGDRQTARTTFEKCAHRGESDYGDKCSMSLAALQ
ncbi:MAG: tetratricopeptide repeat protein [Myxococcota bacterium]